MPSRQTNPPKRSRAPGGAKKRGSARDAPSSPSSIPRGPETNPTAAVERAIARILALRYEQDIARLFSAHLHYVARTHIPKLITSLLTIAAPGWLANNSESEELKDYYRGALCMDLRQAGERVATKSVLWSYTAIRHFAVSNNVPICARTGLHSVSLIPLQASFQNYVQMLEALPPPTFSKPHHLGSLDYGMQILEKHCASREGNTPIGRMPASWIDWRLKVKLGYERMVDTLWRVANEFDNFLFVWSYFRTEQMGEVCERAVREEEEGGKRAGKEREWDGRGAGVYAWGSKDEEDLWDGKLDSNAGTGEISETDNHEDSMTVGELMEWRYFKAERQKERGNNAFRRAEYEMAIKHYIEAHRIEPELPHYQLNLAAAYLKAERWSEAERACDIALGQHRSIKGYWRRAKARKMLRRYNEAAQDLHAILKLQPDNPEAQAELDSLLPSHSDSGPNSGSPTSSSDGSFSPGASTSSAASSSSVDSRIRVSNQRKPLPFELHDADLRKLKIHPLPITLHLPDAPAGPPSETSPLDYTQRRIHSFDCHHSNWTAIPAIDIKDVGTTVFEDDRATLPEATLAALSSQLCSKSTQLNASPWKAALEAWKCPFRGIAHEILLKHPKGLEKSWAKEQNRYAKLLPLVQSSGTAKCRLLDEMVKNVYTIPLNVRDTGDGGYLLPDAGVLDLLTTADSENEREASRFSYATFPTKTAEMAVQIGQPLAPEALRSYLLQSREIFYTLVLATATRSGVEGTQEFKPISS
ncbi:hypothetical protein BOTBODRAFT_181445 [Botryobasidium botryosum FD-172 SS1]|uniref:Uncharacterized protein n=1 Tax=Botryobasidium botryosum (strain FD-172 SS1) TaxID=930990 RepID=A0A067LTE7_BOTB1|nr:hypothetical protein BOTBODRAFT_181445 [Botryobasidium botryosum FD-172 SS1]